MAIQLFDPEVQNDPYATYDELRRTAPVFREPNSGMYVISRYADVRAVLRDTERFRSGIRPATGSPEHDARRARMLDLYREKGWLPTSSLAGYDGQRHKEIRALFTRAFRARRIKTDLGLHCIDGLVDGSGAFDLLIDIEALAQPNTINDNINKSLCATMMN